MSHRILAIDFDGTLCANAWPAIGPPNQPVIDYVKHQQATGARLILWTSRRDAQLQAAVDWCQQQGITFDAVNANLPEIVASFGGDTRKIYADEYIDDKAITPDEITRRTSKIRRCRRNTKA